jgi:hypothetical protein
MFETGDRDVLVSYEQDLAKPQADTPLVDVRAMSPKQPTGFCLFSNRCGVEFYEPLILPEYVQVEKLVPRNSMGTGCEISLPHNEIYASRDKQ